jgi:hypothetical protein
MVENKVLIGLITQEYARRADFYDYFSLLDKPPDCLVLFCHDRSPAHGRNTIIAEAIKHECTHILFVDDDMACKPEALKQLLSHDVDVVTGLYLSRSYPHQPLIFDVADDSGPCLFAYLDGTEPRLKPIINCGFGFCLIKTSVFSKLEKPYVRLGEIDPEQWCDDVGFFNRVRNAGFQIYCDMECRIGHIGTLIIWPNKENGKWMSGYDTSGKTMVNIPQLIPEIVYKTYAQSVTEHGTHGKDRDIEQPVNR